MGDGRSDHGLIEGGSAAVLRAIGSLLVALSGGEDRAQQVAAAMTPPPARRLVRRGPPPAPGRSEHLVMQQGQPASPEPPQAAPAPPPGASPPPIATPPTARGAPDNEPLRRPAPDLGEVDEDEIATLLADARSRAQQILDESMEHASELLEQRSGGVNGRILADIRTSVGQLVSGMSEVRQRLSNIESLIEEYVALASSPRAAEPPPHEPAPFFPAPPPETPAEPPWGGDPVAAAPAPPPPWEAPPPAQFQPHEGPLLLRVSPVAGFQGLMRVQDTLGRLSAVRQATVEAYAQGEARLRVELDAPADAGVLAAGLADGMGQQVSVGETSDSDRTIVLTLG